MIELERTYLAKKLPGDLKTCESKEIIDVYLPGTSAHPKLRLRKNGDKYELTKKEPTSEGDASRQEEQTIKLTEEEFNVLNRLKGKRVRKIRYNYTWNSQTAEIDVFQDALKGLVLIDFEFSTPEEKEKFQMPDFCLADVTQELFTAGGMLCGKNYAEIEDKLEKFGYKKLCYL